MSLQVGFETRKAFWTIKLTTLFFPFLESALSLSIIVSQGIYCLNKAIKKVTMNYGKEFKKYTTKHHGVNSLYYDKIVSSMTPYIIEERQMNVASMMFFRV